MVSKARISGSAKTGYNKSVCPTLTAFMTAIPASIPVQTDRTYYHHRRSRTIVSGGAGSRRGRGGMKTKLQAAKLATAQGIDTIITNGKNPSALYGIVKGSSVGTLFVGKR